MITLKECCKIHPCFSSAIGILNLTLCEFISNNQNLINFIFLQILNDNLTILIEKVKISSLGKYVSVFIEPEQKSFGMKFSFCEVSD